MWLCAFLRLSPIIIRLLPLACRCLHCLCVWIHYLALLSMMPNIL